ncbi:MAG: pyridoxal phosphate-dependent aminotransferase [Anaerolineae bacterium]|nr:pyridoxal phosphate-dependent aminotransferase [Anaerolineae bacterium]
MSYDFDFCPDRLATESAKWHAYGEDVLPLWVADMDFCAPPAVIEALQARVAHGVFGYPTELPELRPVLLDWMERYYHWRPAPEAIVFVPGVVVGFNAAIRTVAAPGDGVLAQTPVYFPILWAPGNHGCLLDEMELARRPDGQYEIDFDQFEAAITPRTRIFVLCNPHNPVGRVFRRDELARMAEICLRHDVIICSDEIHCDLVFPPHEHVPIAALDPEIARRTITLIAPSKTFNIAGLEASVAIIEDEALRKQFLAARSGLVPWVNLMGQVATLAAYREGGDWLAAALRYLEANRDYLAAEVARRLPGVRMAVPEGTYLAWLDCREAGIDGNPHEFFLQHARVAMNNGATFGRGGEGFVRLNFGCPRRTLEEALARMERALAER